MRDSALDAGAAAGPDLLRPVARPHEQHRAFARVIRRENEDRFRLAEAGQVVKVGILAVRVLAVRVAASVHGRRYDRHAVGEFARELASRRSRKTSIAIALGSSSSLA